MSIGKIRGLVLGVVTVVLPFAALGQFTYTNRGGVITINSYTAPGGTVIIPDKISGLPVTRIGEMAFCGHTDLVRVIIPSSVTDIGNYAFLGCTSLASIAIPNSVTNIGDMAFSSCKSLSTILIPN